MAAAVWFVITVVLFGRYGLNFGTVYSAFMIGWQAVTGFGLQGLIVAEIAVGPLIFFFFLNAGVCLLNSKGRGVITLLLFVVCILIAWLVIDLLPLCVCV